MPVRSHLRLHHRIIFSVPALYTQYSHHPPGVIPAIAALTSASIVVNRSLKPMPCDVPLPASSLTSQVVTHSAGDAFFFLNEFFSISGKRPSGALRKKKQHPAIVATPVSTYSMGSHNATLYLQSGEAKDGGVCSEEPHFIPICNHNYVITMKCLCCHIMATARGAKMLGRVTMCEERSEFKVTTLLPGRSSASQAILVVI